MPCDTAGLGSSPFARRYLGNRCYFLFLRVLRCFSSPRSPPLTRVTTSLWPGCPIRKSPDQWLFAPPRSLSQLITSFFASESQGIPHALLVTFSNFLTRISFFSPNPPNLSVGGLACQACFCQYVNELSFLAEGLVEDHGLEPRTPCLQSRCSTS